MSDKTVTCSFCNTSLDPDAKRVFRQVLGWEENRAAGGTNAVALPKRFDEWACWLCIDKQRRSVSVGQESLL